MNINKIRINGIPYNIGTELNIASEKELGVIKVGSGLKINDDGTLSLNGSIEDGIEYEAGTGLKLTNNTFNHINNVSSKNASSQQSKKLNFGDSFNVYEELYDSQGHITGINTTTITMPDVPNVGNSYTLPIASSTVLGGVKIGSNLTIGSDGMLAAMNTTYDVATITSNGLMPKLSGQSTQYLNGAGQWTTIQTGGNYTLPIASSAVLGGIKVGSGLSISADGTLSTNETDLSNYYTKSEIDNKTSNFVISGTLQNYYTKSEIDTQSNNISQLVDQKNKEQMDLINSKQLEIGAVQFDTEPIKSNSNAITSGGVYNALTGEDGGKFIEDYPTANSKKLVNSGSVYESLSKEDYVYIAGGNTNVIFTRNADKSVSVDFTSNSLRFYNNNKKVHFYIDAQTAYNVPVNNVLEYNKTSKTLSVNTITSGETKGDILTLLAVGHGGSIIGGILKTLCVDYMTKRGNYANIDCYIVNGTTIPKISINDGVFTVEVYAGKLRFYNYTNRESYERNISAKSFEVANNTALIFDSSDDTIKTVNFDGINDNVVLLFNQRGSSYGVFTKYYYSQVIDNNNNNTNVGNTPSENVNITGTNLIPLFTTTGYTPSSVNVGSSITVSSYNSENFHCFKYNCKVGDKIRGNFAANSTRPAFFFVDSENVLRYSKELLSDETITIEYDGTAYFNITVATYNNADSYLVIEDYLSKKLKNYNILTSDEINTHGISVYTNAGYSGSEANVGDFVYLTKYTNANYRNVVIPVYKGESVVFRNLISSAPRFSIALIDEKYILKYKHTNSSSNSTSLIETVVQSDGFLIINSSVGTNQDNFVKYPPEVYIEGVGYTEYLRRREYALEHIYFPLSLFEEEGTPIFKFIDRDLENKLSSLYSSRLSPASNTLSLLHFSDIHGNTRNLKSIIDFKNCFSRYIKDIINTGDSVDDYYDDGTLETLKGVNGIENIITAVGNHDGAVKTSNEYNWEGKSKQNVYAALLKPYINNWSVVQPSNAETNGLCYYYKDYTSQKIRLIVLDSICEEGSYQTSQTQWLENTLNDAFSNEMYVVIASHTKPYFNNNGQRLSGSFDTFRTYQNGFYDYQKATEKVDNFITKGGKFICWIVGHSHFDSMTISKENNNQIALSVSTASCDKICDYRRDGYDKTADLFNIISFNTESKIIRILRIGATDSDMMQHNEMMAINWETGQVLK